MSESSRVRILSWMHDMMEVHSLNANQWAKRAGISATTITRFMSGKSRFIPSASSLSALAYVVGSQPPLIAEDRYVEMIVVPVLSSAQVQDLARGQGSIMAAMESADGSVVSSAPAYKNAFVVELSTHTMDAAGIMKGDQAMVSPHDKLVEGRTVVIATDYGASAYRYLPPFLMPVSSDRTLQPLRIHKGIVILGAMVQLIRNVV